MIVVTGGVGFIGSNLVAELNRIGERDILIVDNLTNARKFLNLQGLVFADYMDKTEFRQALARGDFNQRPVRAILHQGACSNTLEDDGRYMMDTNFTASNELFAFAVHRQIPFVYASTAAVYGLRGCSGDEAPLNVYGFSKLAFDNFVRRHFAQRATPSSTIVGLRYFNAYGPREQHKGRMASVLHHFNRQLQEQGTISLFEGTGGFADGEQLRDFVYVRDLCLLNLHFAGLLPASPAQPVHAIVDAGTGRARTFKAVAEALIARHGSGSIRYVPFPDDLLGRYQHFTQADPAGLRQTGYAAPFTALEEGITQTFGEPGDKAG